VDKGFDNGDDVDEVSTGVQAAKRRKMESGAEETAIAMPSLSERQRHKAWVSKGAKGKDQNKSASAWRAQALNRVAAKRCLGMLDNQIRVSTPLEGLKHYAPNPALGTWADWRTWPHLGVGHDLGPDQLSALHAAERKFALNITKTPDIDHGCQRSLIEALKETKLYEFFQLMVISWNLPNGPDNNDYRNHQLRDATAKLAKTSDANSCVPLLVIIVYPP